MSKKYLGRRLFAIHSWLGLIVGICYFVISVGGASIVFYPELRQFLYGHKIKIEKQPGQNILYDEMYAFARKDYPGSRFIRITTELRYPGTAYAINTSSSKPADLFRNGKGNIDYLNPYTGEIVFRARARSMDDIPGLLDSLHVSFNLGTGGTFIVTLLSIALIISIITGLIFYRKGIVKVLLFRVKIKFKNWRTASSDLHRVIGTWAFIFNLCIFSSGLYMQYVYLTPTWWKKNWPPQNKAVIIPDTIPNISAIVALAEKELPINVNSVTIAQDGSKTITVGGTTDDKLFMNVNNFGIVSFDFDGKFIKKYHKKWAEMNGSEKFGIINFNLLHTGWAWGTFGKIIWTLLGFAPAFLSITGFFLWWRKKSKPRPGSKREYKRRGSIQSIGVK